MLKRRERPSALLVWAAAFSYLGALVTVLRFGCAFACTL